MAAGAGAGAGAAIARVAKVARMMVKDFMVASVMGGCCFWVGIGSKSNSAVRDVIVDWNWCLVS